MLKSLGITRVLLRTVLSGFIVVLFGTEYSESQTIEKYEPTVAVDKHNDFRSFQNSSNMHEMTWDPELAEEAADYIKQCNFEHDPNASGVGENLFVTTLNFFESSTLSEAVVSWYNEIVDYDFELNTCEEEKACGHYTQVVWANSDRVGCASVSCESVSGFEDRKGTIVICRYKPPGNIGGNKPFKRGKSCSDCQTGWDFCVNDLCSKSRPSTAASVTTSTIKDSDTATDKITSAPAESETTTKTEKPPTPTGAMSLNTTKIDMTTKVTKKPPMFTTQPTKPSTTRVTPPAATGTARTTDDPVTGVTPPHTTGPSTSLPPVESCSAQYVEVMSKYMRLMDEYQKSFNKWKANANP